MPRTPTLRDVDLNLLWLFDALMATGRLTDAARRLGMTQSAASQALARLRASLDDTLFVRTRTGMEPTATARALAPRVASALATLQEAIQGVTCFDPTKATRAYRVGFGSVGELSLLPPLLAECMATGPGLSVISVPGSSEQVLYRVARGEIELCLDYGAPADAALEHLRLGQDPLVVIARRGHPRVRRGVSSKRFFLERHVVLRMDDQRRARVDAVINRQGLRRDVVAEASHYASIPALVLGSDALAIVPRSLAELDTYRSRLVIAPVPFRLAPLPLFAIWHRAMSSDPGHVWLRERLAALAG